MTSRGRMRSPCLVIAVCARVLGGSGRSRPGLARPDRTRPTTCPAHLAVVDGAVTARARQARRRPRRRERRAARRRSRCAPSAAASEILFGDGSALDLDEDTSVDLLSDSLMRLRGRTRAPVDHARRATSVDYRVDAAAASVLIHSAGEYQRLHVPKRAGRCPKRARGRSAARPSSTNAARPHARARRPACLRRARRRALARGRRSIRRPRDDFDRLGRGPARRAHSARPPRSTCPPRCARTAARSIAYGTWGYERRTARSGIRRSAAGWQPY